MRSWDCSLIENTEEEESWHETKWQRSGRRSKSWRQSWKEEGWIEAPCSWMQRVPELPLGIERGA